MTTARQSQPAEGWDEGDIARENLVWLRGKRLVNEQILGGTIGPAAAGFGHAVPGRNGAQPSLRHDSTHTAPGADAAFIGEFFDDAPAAIPPPVSAKDALDLFTGLLVRELGIGRLCGVVKAAARHLKNGANAADATPCGSGNAKDHCAKFDWVLAPKITAALF